jgi:hypothetical protein
MASDPEKFVGYVQHRLNRVADELKIPRFSHHDLRRTQQTWLREHGWGDAICLAIAGQDTGATVLRNHYWRPNHRRMTLPAFQDVTGIFRDSGIIQGDPLGDTSGQSEPAESGQNRHKLLNGYS